MMAKPMVPQEYSYEAGTFHAWAPAPAPAPGAPHGAVCIGPIVVSGPAWQCAL